MKICCKLFHDAPQDNSCNTLPRGRQSSLAACVYSPAFQGIFCGGQETEAGHLFSKAVVTGAWLLLENVHHSGDWISQLIGSVLSLPGMKPQVDFRLWLSADVGGVPPALTRACQSIIFASAGTVEEVRGRRLVTDSCSSKDFAVVVLCFLRVDVLCASQRCECVCRVGKKGGRQEARTFTANFLLHCECKPRQYAGSGKLNSSVFGQSMSAFGGTERRFRYACAFVLSTTKVP